MRQAHLWICKNWSWHHQHWAASSPARQHLLLLDFGVKVDFCVNLTLILTLKLMVHNWHTAWLVTMLLLWCVCHLWSTVFSAACFLYNLLGTFYDARARCSNVLAQCDG
jgi:hypothetical protein